MKILYVIIMMLFLGMVPCSEDNLKGYSSSNCIQFDKLSKDSTVFSFAYDETLESGTVALKLVMISPLVDRDRKYNVKFLQDESSAQAGVDFEMPAEEQVIAANDSVAYLNVIVKRNKALKGSAIAVFEVQVSDDFMPGIEANRKGRIFITNQLTRPGWWNDWHEANGLGTYSDLKYQTFIREIGVTDMTLEADGGEMNYSTMRAYVLQFKYWLQDHPIEDEDGSLMKVAMRG